MTRHDPTDNARDMAALYLAGALPLQEVIALEARIESWPEVRDAIADLAPVAAVLAQRIEPVAPQPCIRETLLRKIAPAEGGSIEFSFQANETWTETRFPGVRLRMLRMSRDLGIFTALVRMEPGAVYPAHDHAMGDDCFVLQGELQVGDVLLRAGDYQYAPAGTCHVEQRTATGCLLLITAPLSELSV
jgi:quercetin dioxygenase-like cupin family protein